MILINKHGWSGFGKSGLTLTHNTRSVILYQFLNFFVTNPFPGALFEQQQLVGGPVNMRRDTVMTHQTGMTGKGDVGYRGDIGYQAGMARTPSAGTVTLSSCEESTTNDRGSLESHCHNCKIRNLRGSLFSQYSRTIDCSI